MLAWRLSRRKMSRLCCWRVCDVRTMNKFEVLEVERRYARNGDFLARFNPGLAYPIDEDNWAYVQGLVKDGRARVLPPCGSCPLGDSMTNPGAKVVEVIRGLRDEVERAADDMIQRVAKESEKTKDGFHRVQKAVLEPWEAANRELEDFVNQLTNDPPKEKE